MANRQEKLKEYLCNLELNHPNAEVALLKLKDQVLQARIRGYKLVKIIHGYGSGGKGGVLKQVVTKYCREQQALCRIKAYCNGENLDTFSPLGRKLLELAPQVANDVDWNKANYGITVLLLP